MRILENTIQKNHEYDDCSMCSVPIKSFFHYVDVHHYEPYIKDENILTMNITFNRFLMVKQRVLR